MSTCKELGELLHGYLDNELSADEISLAENHLETCADCRIRTAMFRGMKSTLRNRLGSADVPLSLKGKIARESSKPAPLPFPIFRWASVAAILIAIVGTIIVYKQTPNQSHFVVIKAELKIQQHLDKCKNCQAGTRALLAIHIKNTSINNAKLQNHLDGCVQCRNEVVSMVKKCSSFAYLPHKIFLVNTEIINAIIILAKGGELNEKS